MRSSDQSDEMDRWFVEMAKGRRFAVTGGGGYFGRRLGRSLVRYGAREVTLFDMHFIDADESAEDAVMRRVTGDIREAAPIREAVRQADVVFHVASYGMSGREQLNPDRINEINVGGTRNVLEGKRLPCFEQNLSRERFFSLRPTWGEGSSVHLNDQCGVCRPRNCRW